MKSAVPTLPVTNMAEGVDFYHGTLGFEIKHQETDYAVLSCDRVSLHLWAASDESWRKGERVVVSGVESFIAGTHSCRIEVEGIEEIHQDLQPKGIIHPNGQLANKPWGTREFAVLDPCGNLVTFFEKNEQPRPKGRGIRRVRVVYHHVVLCMLYAASGEELNPKLIKFAGNQV